MKKLQRISIVIMLVLCSVLIFTACSNNYESYGPSTESTDIVFDNTNRKLVYCVSMKMDVNNINSTLTTILEKAKATNGYVESSNESGNGKKTTYVSVVLRIPTEKLDEFVETISANGKVTSKRVSITDITTQYVNATAQKSALENRKQLLENLLAESLTASEKINIINEISQVETSLQSIALQQTSYDSMTDYSTVSLVIEEPCANVAAIVLSLFLVAMFATLITFLCILSSKLSKERLKNHELMQSNK